MTVERANEIVDGVEAVLKAPKILRVGSVGRRRFKRLSSTGASTRLELAHAFYIVSAQCFQGVWNKPNRAAEFETFIRDAGSCLHNVLWLIPCMPDSELGLLATLDEKNQPREYSIEEERLMKLAESEGNLGKLGTLDSFVSYLRTLNPDGVDYWPKVYQHIGLECPVVADKKPEQVAMDEDDGYHQETPKDIFRGLGYLTVLFLGLVGFGSLPGMWWKIAVGALLIAGYWATHSNRDKS